MNDVSAAVAHVQTELAELADEDNARAMAAYMKTSMPFYGVKAPERRSIGRWLNDACPPTSAAEVWAVADRLWTLEHREEKYLAVGFLRHHARLLTSADLERVGELIVVGAWWDFVDELAIHVVGPLVRSEPAAVWPVVEAWNEHEDLWLRRSSIICQVAAKQASDHERLFRLCLARAHESEFFIRKAIGWALRSYSKVDPERVQEFLGTHGEELSGLSRREASRHLDRMAG